MFQKIFYITLLFAKIDCQLNQIDLNRCKLSHSGVEYHGKEFRTESGIICQQWASNDPHEVDPSLKDSDFVDGKKSVAKNYCRNPKEMFAGPWCYTTDVTVSDDLCDIPLCSSKCRITIVGSEYSGNAAISQTNRKCLGWSEKHLHKYENRTGISTSQRVLGDDKFPDESRKQAGKRCRNPTGDPNGLWCLVESFVENQEIYEKEYCDVDFCNPVSNCSLATDLSLDLGYCSHYIKFREDSTSFSFDVQLWNLADFNNATIKIALSVLPLPLSGENLYEFQTGIELIIKNSGIGVISSTGQVHEWRNVYGLLSGVTGKKFVIDWLMDRYYIAVTVPGGKNIEFEYTDPESIDFILKNQENTWFSYYSIRGSPALWNIPCKKESECEEHVTLTPTCSIHQKMKKTNFDHVISFFVRSSKTVYIELRNGPGSSYPFFKIDILGAFNKTTLHVVSEERAMPKYLSSVTYENIISDWHWTEFYLSAVEDRLQLTWVRQILSSEKMFDVRHPLVRNAKWLSICSESVAHWAFKCLRNEITPAPKSTEPECRKTKSASNYVGTRWITNVGQPCLPWTYPPVLKETKSYQFPGGSRSESWNYCRNPTGDEGGPFCFVANKDNSTGLRVKKEYCDIPKCLGTSCKISGIGTEYEGDLNISRSNRTCKPSTATDVSKQDASEMEKMKIMYCQNPDKNIFGPWCNTTDPHMKTDLCDIPDCSVNDASTIILKATDEFARRYHFFSLWLIEKFTFKIKTWNPNAETAVGINMFFSPSARWFYSLIIGNENQTKVQLFYVDKRPGTSRHSKLLKEKIIPKIIPAGYWQGFWLITPDRNIEIGFEGSESPIFSWSSEQKLSNMIYGRTTLISFHTIEKNAIGLNFPSSNCFIERCATDEGDAFYPMNLWSESNTRSNVLNLNMMNLNSYGSGPVKKSDGCTYLSHVSAHTLIRFYEENEYHSMTAIINFTSIQLVLEHPSIILAVKHFPFRIIQYEFWTDIKIKWSKRHLEMSTQFGSLFNHTFKEDRRFYYFSVVTFKEISVWIANCPAPNLGPPYIAGGWSDWTEVCNVPCGGGFGFRKRFCNNPKPHVSGLPCTGPAQIENECNQFECGCINPKTIELVEGFLSNRTYNMNVTEYEEMILDCENSVIVTVQNDSPGSHISWLKDGFKISDRIKLGDVNLNDTKLRINDIQIHHSGIYMCVIYPDCVSNENEFVVIKIISVVVMSETFRNIRQSTKLRLDCNSPVLQYFYTDLTQRWELNDFLYIDYLTTDLADIMPENITLRKFTQNLHALSVHSLQMSDEIRIVTKVDDHSYVTQSMVNYEYIADIQLYHEGAWRCYMNQTKLNLQWITNQINIKVTDPPTFFTYLVEVDAPSIIFNGWNLVYVTIFLYVIIAVEIGLVTYVVIWYWRVRKELLQK